jgi:hypothetical protein
MISDNNMLYEQIGEFTDKVIGQVLHIGQDGTPELAQLGNHNHKLWNGNNKRKNRHDAIWM